MKRTNPMSAGEPPAMGVEYRIVDASGDVIRPELFAPYPFIHQMEVVGVTFEPTKNLMIMILRYRHDTITSILSGNMAHD